MSDGFLASPEPSPFPFKHGAFPVRPWGGVPRLLAGLPLALPRPRPAVDWTDRIDIGSALGNDRNSTCVAIAQLRYLQIIQSVVEHDTWAPTEDDVNALYRRQTGDASLQAGTDPNRAFADMARRGWKVRGNDHELIVPRWYVLGDRGADLDELRVAIDLCGAVFLTLMLPRAGTSFTSWELPRPGSPDAEAWGCHEVICGRYDEASFHVTSWDRRSIPAQPEAIAAWAIRSDVLIARQWLDTHGRTPRGATWDGLISAVQLMT